MHNTGPQTPATRYDVHVDRINWNLKIMHAAWHPTKPIVALAAVNNLYLFRQ
jgi:serine/threonine-protein phosphatase 2A regulatory subunit B